MLDLVAYVDGGSLGNPGPSGIGVVIDGCEPGKTRYYSSRAEMPEKKAGLRRFGHGIPQACLGLADDLLVVIGSNSMHLDARALDARILRQPLEFGLNFFCLLRRQERDRQISGFACWRFDFHRVRVQSSLCFRGHTKPPPTTSDVCSPC